MMLNFRAGHATTLPQQCAHVPDQKPVAYSIVANIPFRQEASKSSKIRFTCIHEYFCRPGHETQFKHRDNDNATTWYSFFDIHK